MEVMDLSIGGRKIPLVPAAGSGRKQHHAAGELSLSLLEIQAVELETQPTSAASLIALNDGISQDIGEFL